ncbi:PAS domain-containing protein [Desulfogranum marinum]|uniref:PAS domain-containing protein n=1 Tax=Desulfogranum marinum TaxID=453220 RepID=UPI0019662694|nr:PAS domain-containing protein [Desulfogranum marinum]MBM9512344.1 PAS domain-containing protein [Desulfogranum marinum]
MSDNQKLFLKISVLFSAAAFVLFLMDIRLLNADNSSQLLPFPLFSIMVMTLLCITVIFATKKTTDTLYEKIRDYQNQLNDVSEGLKSTTQDLEERVEKRTFEISVANASLNREIAERIQAETETKKIKRQMELILESAGEGIFGLDNQGNVTFVNKAASIMLDWSPEELIGKSHHDLVHHSYKDGQSYPVEECPIHKAYRDGKVHFGSDELFWTKEGKAFPVEYTSTPIVENKLITGAVVVFRDLTTFR